MDVSIVLLIAICVFVFLNFCFLGAVSLNLVRLRNENIEIKKLFLEVLHKLPGNGLHNP